ncbi:hypothetical protein C8J44_1296 [Sphingomonas sp. PP-CE-3A-406]|nr:hypothetical protein [Sphingomonas sp. PP-CE-3A-406]RMB56025.1 hypothetical protein C8J44_1296 [Sphingomonas sp. PP-CE-3A-406]
MANLLLEQRERSSVFISSLSIPVRNNRKARKVQIVGNVGALHVTRDLVCGAARDESTVVLIIASRECHHGVGNRIAEAGADRGWRYSAILDDIVQHRGDPAHIVRLRQHYPERMQDIGRASLVDLSLMRMSCEHNRFVKWAKR